MKIRIVLIIASLVAVLPSAGRANVEYYWAGYAYAAGASWETSSAYAYLRVEYGAAVNQSNWYGEVYVYDKISRRTVCGGSWILNPGEVLVDPALTNGIVSVPTSPCGAINVTLTGSSQPLEPATDSWIQAWHTTYGGIQTSTSGWVGASWGRDSIASGRIGARSFPTTQWGWLGNYAGSGAYASSYVPTGGEHGN